MEKIKCYKLEIYGSYLIDTDIETILQTLKKELEESFVEGEKMEFSIDFVEMTQDEYKKLPEFDGF